MNRSLITTLIVGTSVFAAPQERIHDRSTEHSLAKIHASRLELGLDARHSFGILRSHQDELGQTHTRMQQYFEGVKIWGGEVIAHVDANGDFLPDTLEHKRDIALSTLPSLEKSTVLQVVDTDLHPKGPYAYEPSVELVIYPETVLLRRPGLRHKADTEVDALDFMREVTRYHLTYHVRVTLMNTDIQEIGQWDYLIDAHSGAILKKWDSLTTGSARGIGKTQHNGNVTLFTNSISGGYELRDMTRGTGGNTTVNMNKGGSTTTGSPTNMGTIYTDPDNTWGDNTNYDEISATTSDNGQTAAADAHFAMQVTWDLFKNVYGRNGLDNTGKAFVSRVHFGNAWDNAFWLDACYCISYGDGIYAKTLTSLDIGAHEMGHGFCSRSANLVYNGESGGLNEANSDIIAALAEIYARAGATGPSLPSSIANTDAAWTFGEQLAARPPRYMYKPSKDGTSPDYWSPSLGSVDVHYSSGPMNRCFFFLSQGSSTVSGSDNYSEKLPGGMAGIGPDKAGRIWYRAIASYMTSTTDYAGARNACIKSAKILYGAGSVPEKAVWNAYAAIGVGHPWGSPQVSVSTTPVSVSLSAGGTYQFNATVTGTSNTAVTWSCSAGTVNNSGLYTAPATSGTFKVTATSVADATISSSATVSVSGGTSPVEKILNGSFESGNTNWVQSLGVIGTFTQQPSFEGKKNAWLCGNGKTTNEYLQQTVTIPATATKAMLSFYLHIDSAETTLASPNDKLYVYVRNTSGTILKTLATYSNLHQNAGYQQKSFDLTAYKGQTIQIYFNAKEDSALQTSFVLDKVSLLVQ